MNCPGLKSVVARLRILGEDARSHFTSRGLRSLRGGLRFRVPKNAST